MTTTGTSAPTGTPVTQQDAQVELAKFFAIAKLADQAPGMFSTFIDAEWHRILETSEYSEFCRNSAGYGVEHAPIDGEGDVPWLGIYHERFGMLTAAWFADENGTVDNSAYSTYLNTGAVRASWKCAPAPPDPDLHPTN